MFRKSQGLLTLLRNTPHVLADSPHMLGTFQRARPARATGYTGCRTDAVHAADQILRFVGGLAGQNSARPNIQSGFAEFHRIIGNAR